MPPRFYAHVLVTLSGKLLQDALLVVFIEPSLTGALFGNLGSDYLFQQLRVLTKQLGFGGLPIAVDDFVEDFRLGALFSVDAVGRVPVERGGDDSLKGFMQYPAAKLDFPVQLAEAGVLFRSQLHPVQFA